MAAKLKKLIRDYRGFRRSLDLTQFEFWSRLGVTQSVGSRYENGRAVPQAVGVLVYLGYVEGMEIGVRHFR